MILQRYCDALEDEYRACGNKPLVAVLGKIAYDELEAHLKLLFDTPLTKPAMSDPEKFEYNGIRVFKSYSINPEAIIFGGRDAT